MGYIEIETKVVPASKEALEKFSRKALRDYADALEVPKGRSKEDTIQNLLDSGRATLCAALGN